MAAEVAANPYVGPRPFEREDAPRFFGRAREVRDVVSLVIAQRVLLLYSASGAGKSSLLNAGVLPVLEEEKGFDVLPVARVRAEDPPTGANVFVSGLLSSLEAGSAENLSLAELLAHRSKASPDGLRVLVVDQFEELFTAHPGRWQDRPKLFDELRDALGQDPALRIVLAIREDFLAQLDSFAAMLPGGLRTRFRLEQLDRTSALAAVNNPLVGTSRSFAPGAAEALVDDLLRFRVDTGRRESEEFEGQYVEPVQLQVACRTLWADLPPHVSEITTQHLSTYADVDQVLGRFYDDAVAVAADRSRRSERRVREWVEETLITPGGTRGAAYAAVEETAGMPTAVVQALEEKRLIRAEWRSGARWYELTHDRLIAPIRRSNAAFRSAIIRKRVRRLILIAAVAGVIAAAGVVYGTATSSGREAPGHAGTTLCTDCQASVSTSSVQPNVSYETYLGRSGAPTAGIGRSSLRRNGVVVRFRLVLFGTGSFRQALALFATNGNIVSVQPTRVVRSKKSTVVERVQWVPVPTIAGRFYVQIRIFAPGSLTGDPALAINQTPPVFVEGQPPGLSKPRVTLTVVKLGTGHGRIEGPGIDCGQICSAQFAFGRRITLQAAPAPGSLLRGWNGVCQGTSSCTVVAGPVTSVAGTFDPVRRTPSIRTFVSALDAVLIDSAQTHGDLGRLISQVQQSGSITGHEARSRIAAVIARRNALRSAVEQAIPPPQFDHAYGLLQKSIVLSLDNDYAIRDWINARINGHTASAGRYWQQQLRLSGQASAAKASFLTVYNDLRRRLLHLQPLQIHY